MSGLPPRVVRHDLPRVGGAARVIHYITTNGIGNAWVGNELRRVGAAGIPFRLHALYRDKHSFFTSEWARELDRGTHYLYPPSILGVVGGVLLAPLRFGGRFWSALWNAIAGERESFGRRVRAIGHFAVACAWAGSLRGQRIERIHSQWIHSCGTVGMYGAWMLGVRSASRVTRRTSTATASRCGTRSAAPTASAASRSSIAASTSPRVRDPSSS